MSELPPALGIERVECAATGADRLTVRIMGRWRRRRPVSGGQPQLVVEAGGQRHRFPAMPEPPSLSGVLPGTWQVSFSVPAWLAPHLAEGTSLRLGGVVVPIPIEVAHGSARTPSVRSSPQAELGQTDEQLVLLRRELCAAEQRLHAEAALRAELEARLARAERVRGTARDVLADVGATASRIERLEQELHWLRQRIGAARARREHARERAIAPTLRAELELMRRTPLAPTHAVGGTVGVAVVRALGAEREMLAHRAERGATPRKARLETTLGALREELSELRVLLEEERAARVQAERTVAGARSAIERLRQRIGEMRGEAPASALPELGPEDEAPEAEEPALSERLDAALSRLREAGPSPALREAALDPERKPWLWPAFRAVAAQDAAAAGRLLAALLPLQGLVQPEYNSVLSEPTSIARLLASGRVARRLRRRRARVRGERARVAALSKLLQLRLNLRELHQAGVRIDPRMAFELVAAMVEPAWTVGESFTLAHQHGSRVCLHVRDGARLSVSEDGPADTTIVCPAELLLAVLGGERPAGVSVRGEERPLALLENWLELAQSA